MVVLLLSLQACGNTRKSGSIPLPPGGTGGDATEAPAEGGMAPGVEGGRPGVPTTPDVPVPACQLNIKYCVGNDVYVCDVTGTTLSIHMMCAAGFHCAVTQSGGSCVADPCPTGARQCWGNFLKTCGADGTYSDPGVDCGEDVCHAGECRPKLCEPTTKPLCWQGDMQLCIDMGTALQLKQACPAGTHCAELPGALFCVSNLCAAGDTVCVANQIGICGVDGVTLEEVATDCAKDQLVCDQLGGCNASALDVTGAGDDLSADDVNLWHIHGNVIDVYSDRIVTQLEAPLRLEEPTNLVWLIYELQDQKYQLRVEDHTHADIGDAFRSSSPLSFRLEAGKRYFVGFHPVDTELGAFFTNSAPTSRRLSFGIIVGGAFGVGSTNYQQSDNQFPPLGNFVQMRITTTLPPE